MICHRYDTGRQQHGTEKVGVSRSGTPQPENYKKKMNLKMVAHHGLGASGNLCYCDVLRN